MLCYDGNGEFFKRIDCRKLSLNAIDNNLTAQDIGVRAADTVEKIALQFDYEYIGMRFADDTLVTLYFVTSAVDLDVDVVTDQTFDIALGAI